MTSVEFPLRFHETGTRRVIAIGEAIPWIFSRFFCPITGYEGAALFLRTSPLPALRPGSVMRIAADRPMTAFPAAFRQKHITCGTAMTIGLALALLLMVPAHSSVTILWEQYQCSGETDWGSPETGYSHTDSIPVADARFDDWGMALSSAWKFGARAETGASREWASASSTFVFTVDNPILIIKFAGSLLATAFPEGVVSYSLTDNFTNQIVGNRSWVLSPGDSSPSSGLFRIIDESVTHELVIGNEYKLLLSANVGNADGTYAHIDAVLVPEHSSLFLLGFAGMFASLHRSRLKNSPLQGSGRFVDANGARPEIRHS